MSENQNVTAARLTVSFPVRAAGEMFYRKKGKCEVDGSIKCAEISCAFVPSWSIAASSLYVRVDVRWLLFIFRIHWKCHAGHADFELRTLGEESISSVSESFVLNQLVIRLKITSPWNGINLAQSALTFIDSFVPRFLLIRTHVNPSPSRTQQQPNSYCLCF